MTPDNLPDDSLRLARDPVLGTQLTRAMADEIDRLRTRVAELEREITLRRDAAERSSHTIDRLIEERDTAEKERDEALVRLASMLTEITDTARAATRRNAPAAEAFVERIRREAKRDGDSEAGCYLLAMFDNPCPANRALVAAFVHRSCGDPLESVQAKLDAMFDLVRAEERDRWEAAFEAARDAVLNRRGSMDGVGFSSEQIAAVLGTLDSGFVAPRDDGKN